MSKHNLPAAADETAFLSQEASETAPDTYSSQAAIRHDGWTLDKQAAFLRALSATHSVSEAARSVGMSRQSAYRLRSRLKGQPLDLAWEAAFHHSYDVLAHAALERALNGVKMPVYFQGEEVGSYRKFDERLTVALLNRTTFGGNPAIGRLAPGAERYARDFEGLVETIAAGGAVETGALSPQDPGELEILRASSSARFSFEPIQAPFCDSNEGSQAEAQEGLGSEWDAETEQECPLPPELSGLSEEELLQHLQELEADKQK